MGEQLKQRAKTKFHVLRYLETVRSFPGDTIMGRESLQVVKVDLYLETVVGIDNILESLGSESSQNDYRHM